MILTVWLVGSREVVIVDELCSFSPTVVLASVMEPGWKRAVACGVVDLVMTEKRKTEIK